jgi:hypothetical protein
MARKNWTAEEEDYVLFNFGKMPSREIAKRLGRSFGAVRHKITQLQLGRERPWEPEEDAAIRELHGKIENKDLASKLVRTVGSLENRITKLGLGKTQPPDWTIEQEDELKRLLHCGLGKKEIAESLGRTVASIDCKMRRKKWQKLYRPKQGMRQWTPEEESLLRRYAGTMTVEKASKIVFGGSRTPSMIMNKCERMGMRWAKRRERRQQESGSVVRIAQTILDLTVDYE